MVSLSACWGGGVMEGDDGVFILWGYCVKLVSHKSKPVHRVYGF
jgi:hypothetical protein